MNVQKNVPLAPYTSFGIGGTAEELAEVTSTQEFIEVLQSHPADPIWLLGYGSNTLISDNGLPGLTVIVRGGKIDIDDTLVTVDAGVWWDDVVKAAIDSDLWGVELMSEVPGSTGAATFINITAYGQSIGPLIEWVEVWDPHTMEVRRISRADMEWDYKKSIFQKPENAHLVILRTQLKLSSERTDELIYQKALDVAAELGLDTQSLTERRDIIIEARSRAGSLWRPDKTQAKTAGSFFRNPVVPTEVAELVMSFDETGKTKQEIKKMNAVHGGDTKRVSAAHVMLAAGFTRGQQWGHVKLNEQNLLKIEALSGATAQDVYDVAMRIQKTCYEKFNITLEPEARILGEFGMDVDDETNQASS